MLLGEKLRKLRIARKLSQEQLADELRVSRQAISKWELGESIPDTENLISLSKFYGVSLDYLLLDELNVSNELEIKRQPHSSVFVLGISGLIIGLIVSFIFWITYQSMLMVSLGLIIQIVSVTLVLVKQSELPTKLQRLFLMISTWTTLSFICFYVGSLTMKLYPKPYLVVLEFIVEFMIYLLVCTVITIGIKKMR